MGACILLIILIILLYLIYFWLTRGNYFEKRGIIHLKPLPLVGNTIRVLLRIDALADFIHKIYYLQNEAKYIGFYDFAEPVIMIRDAELIKSITIKNFDHFVDHRGLVDANLDPFFGRNLFVLKGQKWREMRNLLSPAFTSSKIKAMFTLMSNCAENFVDYLANEAEKSNFDVNSKDVFSRYTNDVIATCAFGISVDSMRNPENEFYTLGRKATTFDCFTLLKFILIKRLPILAKLLNVKILGQKVEDFFMALVKYTVESRDSKGIIRPDMIQLMMESRKNNSDDGPNLTIQEMTSQALIFFFGGFETVSALMCFLAHFVSIHAEVQKKLQDEVDEMYVRCQGNLTYEDINSMQYLEAVIYETLRLYPILPVVDRVCTKTFELPPSLPGRKPMVLRPGDSVLLPIYSLHRRSDYFPNAEKFDPDRFIEDPKRILHHPAFMPFGVGPRMCIGNRFALLEIKVLLFHLIAKCSLKPAKKMILPLELSTKYATMSAKGDFWLTLTPRDK